MMGMNYRTGISLAVCLFFLTLLISRASAMELNVVISTGQSFKIKADSEDTVKKVKDSIYTITEISYLNQAVFKGKQKLNDKNTLAFYSIKDGDTLYVHHGVESGPIGKSPSGLLPIIIMLVVILAIGIYFIRKKPPADNTP
ncbi:MAG: ubiquitin-like domain-containing protein [Candidatus Latescibacter sp.]|nr:ubiquitin-like domain-containing protein [Candidatus Latescibacter sp.]